jgi:pimeloyl-ACP methyl ester carboxylesterase
MYCRCTADVVFMLRYRVVAMDLRGHGLTRTSNDTDFSTQVSCLQQREHLSHKHVVHDIAKYGEFTHHQSV